MTKSGLTTGLKESVATALVDLFNDMAVKAFGVPAQRSGPAADTPREQHPA
jgi:hypothetical protein